MTIAKVKKIHTGRNGVLCLYVMCPFCEKQHIHGGGKIPIPMQTTTFGTRAPECDENADYEVIYIINPKTKKIDF